MSKQAHGTPISRYRSSIKQQLGLQIKLCQLSVEDSPKDSHVLYYNDGGLSAMSFVHIHHQRVGSGRETRGLSFMQ